MPRGWSGKQRRRRQRTISKKLRSLQKRLTRMAGLVEHQFDDMEQQRDAAYTGMWIFLSTEVLFFGAVFFAYVVYRGLYFDAFAEGSRELSIVLGSVNT